MTTFEIYKDRKKEWRWRAKRKGRIVADSGEGYKRRNACVTALRHLAVDILNGNQSVIIGGVRQGDDFLYE